MKTKEFKIFLRHLVASGRHYFLKSEVMDKLAIASPQFNTIASRFTKEKLIRHLSHGFFLIISDVRSHLGFPYFSQFLDKYMEHIGIKYYVSLLWAAGFYGSSHQQPQLLQVITENFTKDIIFDKATLSFHSLAHRFTNSSYEKKDMEGGGMNIASVEQVCIDLITFYEECGYWNNVCTIMQSLINKCNATRLSYLISFVKTSVLQRLGYIFELSNTRNIETGQELIQKIKLELAHRKVYYVLLSPSELAEGTCNKQWKLTINDTIEPDL